mgnify:CR=1 FL=1
MFLPGLAMTNIQIDYASPSSTCSFINFDESIPTSIALTSQAEVLFSLPTSSISQNDLIILLGGLGSTFKTQIDFSIPVATATKLQAENQQALGILLSIYQDSVYSVQSLYSFGGPEWTGYYANIPVSDSPAGFPVVSNSFSSLVPGGIFCPIITSYISSIDITSAINSSLTVQCENYVRSGWSNSIYTDVFSIYEIMSNTYNDYFGSVGISGGLGIDKVFQTNTSNRFIFDFSIPFAYSATPNPIAWNITVPIVWNSSQSSDVRYPTMFGLGTSLDVQIAANSASTILSDNQDGLISGIAVINDNPLPIAWSFQTYAVALDISIPIAYGSVSVLDRVIPAKSSSFLNVDVKSLFLSYSSVAEDIGENVLVSSFSSGDVTIPSNTSVTIGNDSFAGTWTQAALIQDNDFPISFFSGLSQIANDFAVPILVGSSVSGDCSIPIYFGPSPWFRHEWCRRVVAPDNTYVTYVEGLPVRIILR